MPETAQGSAQERVGRPTHQSKGASEKAHKQAKRLKMKQSGNAHEKEKRQVRALTSKWEGPQSSAKCENTNTIIKSERVFKH